MRRFTPRGATRKLRRMYEMLLFLGCIAIPVLIAVVVARSGTALFGLTVLNMFNIASASLPVFFFGTLFGAMPETFTADHLYVVAYSELGLLAMVGGMYLAWRPLTQHRAVPGSAGDLFAAGHLTLRLGLLSFYVGIVADLLDTSLRDV